MLLRQNEAWLLFLCRRRANAFLSQHQKQRLGLRAKRGKGMLTCAGAPQRKRALTNERTEMTMRNGSVALGLRIRLRGAMHFDAGLVQCEDMRVRHRADTWSKRLSDCGVHGGERECFAGERLGMSCSGMLEQTLCFFVGRLSSFACIRTQHCALL